jgi:RNA polymerase sigma factor (sigma-70 family)
VNNLANASRQFTGTQMRAVRREVPLPAVPLDDLPHGTATGPQEAMDREQAERVRRAMQGLPEHYRTVLKLRYEQDLTFEQIAAVINRSAEATRKLWARAVTSLQQQLATGDAS